MSIRLMVGILLALLLLAPSLSVAASDSPCNKYRPLVQREMNLRFGYSASAPVFAGLLKQESSCNPMATNKADGGAGVCQLTGANNIRWIAEQTGMPIDPYNPSQAIPACIWLLHHAYRRFEAVDDCNRMAMSLKAFNAGEGWVLKAVKLSAAPKQWLGLTENINAGQSVMNFDYSRAYPHKIIEKHQLLFASWGRTLCLK